MDSNYTENGIVGGVLPVLAISAGLATTIKTTNAYVVKIDGAISKISAGILAVIPATITVPLLSTSSIDVYVNSAGVASYVQGTTVLNSSLTANTIYDAKNLPVTKANAGALIGSVIISTTGAVTFIGGTTALDTAGLVVTYLDRTNQSK